MNDSVHLLQDHCRGHGISHSPQPGFPGGGGGGVSGLKSAFNLSRSYHRLQGGFGGVCRCMRVQVGWDNLNLFCLGRTTYARQFLGAKPPTQFRHRWEERNHSDHYTDSEPANQFPKPLVPSWEAQTSQFLRLWCDAVGDRIPASHTPSGRFNH